MAYGTFQYGQGGPPPAAFAVTQLVVSSSTKTRIFIFTFVAVVFVFLLGVAGILAVQQKLGLLGHASPRLLLLAALPGMLIVVFLISGVRRYNARRLRRQGKPAQMVLSPQGVRVESAEFPLALPWPQIVYIQPQGASTCTVPALDPERRQVLFVDVPAARLAEAIAYHSGGRTAPHVVQVGQAGNSLRNVAAGYAQVFDGRRRP